MSEPEVERALEMKTREEILQGYIAKIQDQIDCYLTGADPRDCLAEISELAASALTGNVGEGTHG